MQHLTSNAEKNIQTKHQRDESSEGTSSERAILQKLAKHNFKSKIAHEVQSFPPGTRDWFLKKLDEWFTAKDESRLLLLTACPGFGKSVFAAKVCELYGENGKLGAYHFCDRSNLNLKDPVMMLESLAGQMCENVSGFEELLLGQLKRHHKICNLNDAFQIYLQNSLNELKVDPFLIVIDGLDECATDEKSDMEKLIADLFPDLPMCVKVLVTSRPGLSLEKLSCIKRLEIEADDHDNGTDLRKYLEHCLPLLPEYSPIPQNFEGNISNFWYISDIVTKCNGSFLYAFHVQRELRQRRDLDTMTFKEITSILPQRLGSIYKEYFQHLENELKAEMKKDVELFKLLELLAAAEEPLPLAFIARTLGSNVDCCDVKRIIAKVNDATSCLLYVSNDLVTVFHKSVCDWLLANGCEDHEFTVKAMDGKKRLWLLCKPIFEEVKENVILGDNLKLTNEVKHALENGYDYLVTSNLTESFGWLVDVVIVHIVSTTTFYSLKDAWCKVLGGDTAIGLELRRRISWHFAAMCYLEKMFMMWMLRGRDLGYLEFVIDYSPPDCFTESEMNIAKSIVAKVPRCIKRDSTRATAMATLLMKPVLSRVAAVGVSSSRQLAAVSGCNGTVFILSLPELVTIWQYSTGYKSICCCVFAPNDSYVLFGKLETVLCIEKKKEISYFRGIKEQFKFCAFSPDGKRLVTSDGSSALKLWDVVRQSLVSVVYSDVPLNSCSFSNTGFFLVGYTKPIDENSYCVWNTITFQRVDVRKLRMNKSNKGEKIRQSEICRRCCRKEHAVSWGFTEGLKILRSCRIRERFSVDSFHLSHRKAIFFVGIYGKMDCLFCLDGQFFRVIECIHFTTLAAWEIVDPRFVTFRSLGIRIVDVTSIVANTVLVASEEDLVVFSPGTQKEHSSLSPSALVLWCSFSPDSTRLATCTSDGFVNLWNVSTCQIYQRVRNNIETYLISCCWSNDQLFVFHLTEEIPTCIKYHIDENFEIDLSKVESVSLCCLVNELEGLSSVLEFSQGYLSFKTVGSVKVLNINITENPEVAILPNSESMEDVAVSVDASIVFGSCTSDSSESEEKHFILWKKNKSRPVEYEIFVSCDIPIGAFKTVFCCFSDDLKHAVAFCAQAGCRRSCFVIIDAGTGKMVVRKIFWKPFDYPAKVFCANSTLVIAGRTYIRLAHTQRRHIYKFSLQHCLSDDLLIMSKLSPDGNVIAVPNATGAIEFLRLSIPAAWNSSESS